MARINDDDQVELREISAFWAVMLAGRDTARMVNMIPYMEEYKCLHPVARSMVK